MLLLFDLMGTLLLDAGGDQSDSSRLGAMIETRGILPAVEFGQRYAAWRSWRDAHSSNVEVSLRHRLIQVLPILELSVAKDIESQFCDEYQGRSRPQDGVRAMLVAWQDVATMGVVSNFMIEGMPQRLLKCHQLSEFFDFVLDSASIGFRKPATEIFNRALSFDHRPGDHAASAVMIGDDWEADIEGARRVGLTAFHYSQGVTRDPAIRVIRHWDEFRPPLTPEH